MYIGHNNEDLLKQMKREAIFWGIIKIIIVVQVIVLLGLFIVELI